MKELVGAEHESRRHWHPSVTPLVSAALTGVWGKQESLCLPLSYQEQGSVSK